MQCNRQARLFTKKTRKAVFCRLEDVNLEKIKSTLKLLLLPLAVFLLTDLPLVEIIPCPFESPVLFDCEIHTARWDV